MVGTASTATDPVIGGERASPWRLLLNNRLATAGLLLLLLIVLLAFAAPLLPLANPDLTAPADRLLPPLSEGHLLGTDALGRDLLARLVWGTRISLAVGVSATLLAALVGSLIGLLAGYAGGTVDMLLMRGIDTVMAFPYILLALVIVAVLGPSLLNALYAIAIVNIPFFARNIRGITLGLSRREFIDAARLAGQSNRQILFAELLPNVLPVIVITISTTLGWMILETAGLSFLGLGAQPPQADLGSMLGQGRKLLFTTPHVSVIPGLMIFVLVMSINLLGDGVRDLLDPRLKAGALSRPLARTEISHNPAAPMHSRPSAGALLEADNLQTEFHMGRSIHRAVGGVDLRLERGECLGIVGESGSGKSVMALSLMGLVPTPPGRIVAGNARLQGEELFLASDERIRQLRGAAVAHVFQDPLATLHPLYRVGEQLIEAILAHQPLSKGQAKQQAERLLAQVQIANPARRMLAYPHQLSGGMRQRVCIAMALANDIRVLIADEPTTALDVTVQAQILGLLRRMRETKDAAILFITHDFSVVSTLCDRVAVMYAGKIVESGHSEAILTSPAHPYSKLLLQSIPVLGQPERRLEAISGQPPQLNALPTGCAFAPRCPRAEADCRHLSIALRPLSGNRTVRCLHPWPLPSHHD